jgi:hypothetical protein
MTSNLSQLADDNFPVCVESNGEPLILTIVTTVIIIKSIRVFNNVFCVSVRKHYVLHLNML